jgi:hypothetical protein
MSESNDSTWNAAKVAADTFWGNFSNNAVKPNNWDQAQSASSAMTN